MLHQKCGCHKCDEHSFGMLLFEIIRKRNNLNDNLPDSKMRFQCRFGKEMGELRIFCGIEEKYRETAERMMKVDFRCVQYKPKLRPLMSLVVKMLEGAVEIPTPLNP